MNEEQIRASLTNMHSLAGTDTDRRLARAAVQRDRKRLWLLAGLAIVFWLVAAAGILFVVYAALFHLYPKHQKLMHDFALGTVASERMIELQALHFRALEICTLIVAAAFLAATLAAICTLLLIFVSRRATLRQINANLLEIFEQLQQPRPSAAQQRPDMGQRARE